ncbi:hypothetical protein [Chachezhania sediminis]|uniref:hypothetical protein n=1 Tax=Chachezhania sediminis TaxID=2599291 RepID=UPI00131B8FCE|nr:hypothetical protein [Chachezhania sediminis]
MWTSMFDVGPGRLMVGTLDSMRLGWAITRLAEDARTVIAIRIMGLSGLLTLPQGESTEMVREKMPAVVESATAAALTAWTGADVPRIWLATLEPFQAGAQSNRERLAGQTRSEIAPATTAFPDMAAGSMIDHQTDQKTVTVRT